MLIFGLRSTSHDWPSDLSNESHLNCEKRSPKSSKNKILVFGLHSTSDDWLSDLSNESQPKCDKRPPKSSKNEMLIFGLRSTSDDRPSNQMTPPSRKNLIFFKVHFLLDQSMPPP